MGLQRCPQKASIFIHCPAIGTASILPAACSWGGWWGKGKGGKGGGQHGQVGRVGWGAGGVKVAAGLRVPRTQYCPWRLRHMKAGRHSS